MGASELAMWKDTAEALDRALTEQKALTARWEEIANAAGDVIAELLDVQAEEEHAFHGATGEDGIWRKQPQVGCLLCDYELVLGRSLWAGEEVGA